ncbi:MAG: outer membrane beta-barrel protein [Bacteroidia bacterium]|nr:outer membrane beta-barrel protein [Bacteroidia bacterium]
MKKLFITGFLTILIIFSARSQSIRIGGGLVMETGYHYNNETAGISSVVNQGPLAGITFTFMYKTDRPFNVSPTFTYFLPRTNTCTDTLGITSKTRVSSTMFNIDGHYVIYSLDRFGFYGLAGFNIHFTKIKWFSTDYKEHDNAFGLNIGCGSDLKLSEKISVYTEAKYTLFSKYSQLIFNAGLLVNFSWSKKQENKEL